MTKYVIYNIWMSCLNLFSVSSGQRHRNWIWVWGNHSRAGEYLTAVLFYGNIDRHWGTVKWSPEGIKIRGKVVIEGSGNTHAASGEDLHSVNCIYYEVQYEMDVGGLCINSLSMNCVWQVRTFIVPYELLELFSYHCMKAMSIIKQHTRTAKTT